MTASENPTRTATSASSSQPVHYLDTHALKQPDKVALICEGRSLTYSELNARARRVAHMLSALGVKRGDRVAVMAYNSLETLVITGGLSKLNAIPVLLNYRLRADEVAYILNDCQAKAAIAGPQLVAVVDRARSQVEGEMAFIAVGKDSPHGSR
jgi:fatty-acyl-CoA synthase